MTSAISVEELGEKVDYLLDRQAVMDCIHRYSRALDRHDIEMMRTVYHPDGVDEHGSAKFQDTDKFMDWMNSIHDEYYTAHQHHMTVHNCELDGPSAHAESYVIVTLSTRSMPQKVWVTGGRYIDKLQKRSGEWRIAHRTSVLEWAFEANGDLFTDPKFTAFGFPTGTHDQGDRSYERPLTLTPESERQLNRFYDDWKRS